MKTPQEAVGLQPQQSVTPALHEDLRQHKTALLDLVEEWSERAAMAEYCGGLAR